MSQISGRKQIGTLGLTQPFIQGAAVVMGLILARNLVPHDYGIVAMATGFTSLGAMVAGFGLSDASVQRDELTSAEASALFWLNLALGIAMAGLCVAIGPVLAGFFGEPDVETVATWAGVAIVLSAIGSQPRAQLFRAGRYGSVAIVDLAAQVGAGGIAIAAAMGGHGWRALVAFMVALPAIRWVGNSAASRWLPGAFHRSSLPVETVKLGAVICAGWVLSALSASAESLALGRLKGAAQLGLYSKGMQLARYPVLMFSVPAFLPAVHRLSRLRSEPAALEREQTRALGWVLVLMSLALGVLAGSAPDLVPLLLGEQWRPSARLMQLASFGMLGLPITQTTTWALTSYGRRRKLLGYQVLTTAVPVLAAVSGALLGGASEMCVAFTIGVWLVLVPFGLVSNARLSGSGSGEAPQLVIRAVAVFTATALGAGGVGFVCRTSGLSSTAVVAFVEVAAGGLCWLALSRMWMHESLAGVAGSVTAASGLERSPRMVRAIEIVFGASGQSH